MEQVYFTHTALRYGAYSGAASIVIFVIIYMAGYNPMGASGWLGAWIPALFIILAIQHFKSNISKGQITYGRAFRLGWNITLAWAFVYAGFSYIFGKTIGHNLLEWQKYEAMLGAEQAKALFNEAFYKESLKSIENTTLGVIAVNDFFMKLIGGAVSSLIVAAFMKNNMPAAPTSNDELNETP